MGYGIVQERIAWNPDTALILWLGLITSYDKGSDNDLEQNWEAELVMCDSLSPVVAIGSQK